MASHRTRRTSGLLRDIYGRLRGHFGHMPKWWPGTPTEITITAMLVQQCDWSVAWAAIRRLHERGLVSLPGLAAADPQTVFEAIHPVAFAPTKARRIIRLAQSITAHGFTQIEPYLRSRPAEAMRENLLSHEGIGQETADSILLYASEHPSFVIDAYTRRVFERLRRIPGTPPRFWSSPYPRLKRFFEEHVLGHLPLYDGLPLDPDVPRPVALLRDFHAQIVELGKHHCQRSRPCCHSIGRSGWKDYSFCRTHCTSPDTCHACPLEAVCAHARQDPRPATRPGASR